MKNKLLLLFVISLLILPNVSFADNDSATSSRVREENREQTIKDEIEAKKEALKNSVEERRQNVTDKIEERVLQFIQKIIERFDAATNRLIILSERIDSRISKMKVAGIEVTEAEKLLTEARLKIKTAETSVINISFEIDSLATTTASTTKETVKEKFEITKLQIEEAKENLKEAHAALVDVINSLKPGYNKLKNSVATSTATSTATTTDENDN